MKAISRVSLIVSLLLSATLVVAQTDALAKDKANLDKLQKQYAAAKTVYAKKSKDASIKKKYVSATVAFGTATMMTGTMKPKDKYAGALRLYREALKLDPKNAEALKNKAMIEDIYRSMGRPIPK